MNIKKYTLGCLILILVGRAFAIGVPNLDLDQLVASSNLVAVVKNGDEKLIGPGNPIVFQHQTIKSQTFCVESDVKRTIKGSPPNNIKVCYDYPIDFLGYRKPGHGLRIIFLREHNGQYTFTDPYYPDLPGQSDMTDISSTDPVQNVLEMLAKSIASADVPFSEKREILGIDYALPPSKFVIEAFKRGISTTPDSLTREKILSDLIGFGDVSELGNAVHSLLTNGVSLEGKSWLLYSISEHVKDPNSISSLQLLYQSGDTTERAAAMEALWHIANSKSVKLLAQGLVDPSQDVKYYAVRGLADIMHEPEWGPSIPEFQEHGQRYIDFWLVRTGRDH